MFRQLVSHNDDLRRLLEKGYAIAFDSNHLIVRDVPYLDETGAARAGAFVCPLDFVDQQHVRLTNHQILFSGGPPHGLNGKPIPNLGGGPATLALTQRCSDLRVERSFSHKPLPSGHYLDLFHKIETYAGVIAGPAIDRHGSAVLTFRAVEVTDEDPIFKFNDTLTSRARIGDLRAKLEGEVIALIGLGGTGSYLLDLLIKSPVREIHAFDHDTYHIHNAYRSPGSLAPEDLGRAKAEVFQKRYENFRTGLRCEVKLLDRTSTNEVAGITFAFVCVDKGSARKEIVDLLIDRGIPFIDVGMGLLRRRGELLGMLRTTYVAPVGAEPVRELTLLPLADEPDAEYKVNIQIAELNALNAAMAIIKFKQLRGFYGGKSADHLAFDVADLMVAELEATPPGN